MRETRKKNIKYCKENCKKDNNVEKKLVNLEIFLSKYKFEDIFRAIYCINLCLDNRSMMGNLINLNFCLYKHKQKGRRKIRTYKDFLDFFHKLELNIPNSENNFKRIKDFGEIKIEFLNKTYDVIIGTGYERTYGIYQFLPIIAEGLDKEKHLESVLKYISDTIKYFRQANTNNTDEEMCFKVPSQELFERTHQYFNEEIKKINFQNLLECFQFSDNELFGLNFISRKGIIYPLYNPSILLDLYNFWLKSIVPESIEDIIDFKLQVIIEDFKKQQGLNTPKIYSDIITMSSDDDETEEAFGCSFIIDSGKGLIIGVRSNLYNKSELKEVVSKIYNLHDYNKLEFYIEIEEENYNIIKYPKGYDVNVIVIDNNISLIPNIDEHFFVDDRPILVVNPIDLINIFFFSEKFSDFYQFTKFCSNNKSNLILSDGGIASLFLAMKNNSFEITQGAIEYEDFVVERNLISKSTWSLFKEKLYNYPWDFLDIKFRSLITWTVDVEVNDYLQHYNGKASQINWKPLKKWLLSESYES